MKRFYRIIFSSVIFVSILCLSATCTSRETQLSEQEVYIWSHNDYEQSRPLEKALELGFQMIEADIHLIDGKLYVIHDHPENPEQLPLLEDLYLGPLAERISRLNGVVLTESNVPFYLVIDVKTPAEPTFEAISEVLEPYSELFTRIENGKWIEGPIKLLISGNRPALNQTSPDRIAFIDGRIPDIGAGYSAELYPIISDNWNNYFSWDGIGDMPVEEFEVLSAYVESVHDEEKLIRFWATPDRESVWEVLLHAGVDIINVDDLKGMREFLDTKGLN